MFFRKLVDKNFSTTKRDLFLFVSFLIQTCFVIMVSKIDLLKCCLRCDLCPDDRQNIRTYYCTFVSRLLLKIFRLLLL